MGLVLYVSKCCVSLVVSELYTSIYIYICVYIYIYIHSFLYTFDDADEEEGEYVGGCLCIYYI